MSEDKIISSCQLGLGIAKDIPMMSTRSIRKRLALVAPMGTSYLPQRNPEELPGILLKPFDGQLANVRPVAANKVETTLNRLGQMAPDPFFCTIFIVANDMAFWIEQQVV